MHKHMAAFLNPLDSSHQKIKFVLLNVPFYFCKLIAQVLRSLINFILLYMNIIVVFSLTSKRHMKDMDYLEQIKLTKKSFKCNYVQDNQVESRKRLPNEAKIQAIFSHPHYKTQMCSYFGIVWYYPRYIKDYA